MAGPCCRLRATGAQCRVNLIWNAENVSLFRSQSLNFAQGCQKLMRSFWPRLVCLFLFLNVISAALSAQQPGQVTLTGSVTSASGASVQIQLINCGQYNPRVLYNGSLLNVVVPHSYTVTPDASGNWSQIVWPNDLLVCGGTTGASAYQVTYTQNGTPSGPPENFQVASTGPNPYNTTTQPPLKTLPPANAQNSNFDFQSLTLGNSLNAQTGSIGALNVKSLTINGQPIAAQGQAVPDTGGTVSGTLSQNFTNYFNPQLDGSGDGQIQAATIGNVKNYFWSGTLAGTAADNHGQYLFNTDNVNLVKNTPGCAGFGSGIYCYNTESVPFSLSEFLNAQGGTNGEGINVDHYGLGDTIGTYYYLNSFGGQEDGGGPEGAEIISGQYMEPPNTYTGTITTAGQGQTTLALSCTNDCGSSPYGFGTNPLSRGTPASLGQGLRVMDEQTATASGQIESVQNPSGETPGTMTLNLTSGASNLAVSTCYGTLGSALSPSPDPAGSGTQSVTFTLTLASGSGSCVAGQVASFSGFMHDQALITAVGAASGGQQQITASIRQYHEAGSYMFENPNSDAGLYMDVIANNVNGVQYPIDILGVQSISGNTAVMWYRWFLAGMTPSQTGFPYGNMVLNSVSATSISNTGGTVTLSGASINQNSAWLNHNNLYISNASNAAFDGECTNAALVGATVTCTQSASTGDTATSATITLTDASGTNPYGNSDVNFYQGAAVVNTQDTSAPTTVNGQTVYPTDGKQFEVEANEMPLASGDKIVEGHSAAMMSAIENVRSSIENPMAYSDTGIGVTMTGAYSGPSINGNQNFGAFSATNASPYNTYDDWGGTQNAPVPILLRGVWNGLAHFYTVPEAFSSLINDTGCTADLAGTLNECTDPGYWFNLYYLQGNGGNARLQYVPYTNTLQFNGNWQFNGIANNASFKTNVAGDTYAVGFGGRTGAATQYAPLWDTTAPTQGDVPEVSNCNVAGDAECGLKDSGVAVSSLVPLTPATLALGTSAIAANSCASVQTVTVSGANTSMVAVFSGDGVLASSVTGYSSLKIDASVTAANTISVQVCNPTAASITPGALTLNVTAMQ